MLISALLKSIDHFSYITSTVVTPVVLLTGTYIPYDNMPRWAQVGVQLNPLHHCVEMVRHASFDWHGGARRRQHSADRSSGTFGHESQWTCGCRPAHISESAGR